MKLTKASGATLAASAAALILGGASFAPTTAQAEEKNVQCYGVNACKGNGSCKTASNACKGQNSCKGQAFVLVSADACKAIGGKTSAG